VTFAISNETLHTEISYCDKLKLYDYLLLSILFFFISLIIGFEIVLIFDVKSDYSETRSNYFFQKGFKISVILYIMMEEFKGKMT
jgi:hypothetical protein